MYNKDQSTQGVY